MKRILLLLLILHFAFPQLYSQQVTWVLKDSLIEITYNLPGTKPDQTFNVSVYVSRDGGTTYSENPLSLVTGDVGKGVKAGTNKKILWNVFKEMPDFGGIIVFDVRPEVKAPKRFYLGYKGSITAPLGFVAGFSGNTGFYFSSRLNTNLFINTTKEFNGTLPGGWGYIEESNKFQRFSLTAGIQQQLSKKVHFYAGIGYTTYNSIWQIKENDYPENTEWAKDTEASFSSMEIEGGLFFQFDKVFLSGGISWYNKKYTDFIFAIGYVF